jgi:deoxyadenosine/deoxycytidine kinase
MERSIYSARNCFVETLKETGKIHEGAYFVLQEWYEYIDEYHKIECDLIIYIQVEPEIAFQRINERSRKGENAITLEYLKALHKRHEQLFVEEASKLQAKVLIIDGNLNKEEIVNEYKKCEGEIFQRTS